MSNVTPHNGPNRLFRYVEPGLLPSPNVVSYLHKDKNLLLINKELFEKLPWYEKQRVWNTDRTLIEVAPPSEYFGE